MLPQAIKEDELSYVIGKEAATQKKIEKATGVGWLQDLPDVLSELPLQPGCSLVMLASQGVCCQLPREPNMAQFRNMA